MRRLITGMPNALTEGIPRNEGRLLEFYLQENSQKVLEK